MEVRQTVADDVLYMVTLPSGSMRFIDADFAALIGFAELIPSDLQHQHWQDVLPNALHEAAAKATEAVVDSHQADGFECQLHDNKALIAVKPLMDEGGNVIALTWHGQALQKAQYYKEAFDNSFVAQWVASAAPLQAVLQKYQIQHTEDVVRHLSNDSHFFADFRWQLKLLKCNDAALKLFRLTEAESFKLELVHHLSEHGLIHIVGNLLETENTRQFFHQDINMHGEKKTFWFSCELAGDALYFSAMDISNLKSAEQSLEEREQFLDATVKAIPDYLLVYDFIEQGLVFQNKNLLSDLGYELDELAESNQDIFTALAHKDDLFEEAGFAKIYQYLNLGKVFETTMRLKHKDGYYHHFYFRAAPLNTEKGLRSAVVIGKDITEALDFENRLSEKRRHYQLLADNFTDVVITTDTLFRMNYSSSSLQEVLGYNPETFIKKHDAIQCLGLEGHHEAMAIALADSAMRLGDDDNDYEDVFVTQALHADGSYIPLEVKLSILRDENKKLEGMLVVLRDIRERQVYENKQLLAAKVFENSMDAIYITDSDGLITQVNKTFCDITGYRPEKVIGNKPSVLSSGWRDNNFSDHIKPEIREHGRWTGELMSRRANGEAFLAGMSITQVDSVQGESLGFITTFKDITEAKSSEENIKKLAYFDPLTELPNRMLYQDRLNQAIQRSMRNRLYIVVLFLDLDGFKQVNDDFGHALGDVLLTEVARRLEQSVRGDDTVARMGGDEFTVILHALRTRELAENAASQISAKIISVLNQPFLIQGKEIRIGTSIGISTYPDDGNSIEELTKHADTAMYHAKECGKNNYQFFTEDMHQRAAQRQLIEKDILTALENGKFVLAYQPKLDVQKQKLKGFEALLRWNHSEKGMMAPNMFLKAFEDLGLGHQVGEYVLELACRKLKTFAAEGLSSIGVSVNIFARQFRDAGFIASVAELIDSNGIEPDRLTLEFSEKILMEDVGMSFSILSELKRLGVRLAIDDFATGLLSLQTLRRLPLDEVKIDRHMLIQIDKDAEQIDFVFALIEFARNMKLAVTVEGIERSTQLQLVKKSRADVAQGYLFAKPVLEDQLDEMIQQFLLND